MTLEEKKITIDKINQIDFDTSLTGQIIVQPGYQNRDDSKYYLRIYNARLYEDKIIIDVEEFRVDFNLNELGRYRILKSISLVSLNNQKYASHKEFKNYQYDKSRFKQFNILKEHWNFIETNINKI